MPLFKRFLGFHNAVHAVGTPDENNPTDVFINNSKLNWVGNLNTGMLNSTPKWSSILGDDRVSLVDQIEENNRIALLIEPGMPREKIDSLSFLRSFFPSHEEKLDPSMKAYGYFFTRSSSGLINLLLRSKPLSGEEQPTVFHDITYFGLKFQQLSSRDGLPSKYSCHFIATFEHGQVRLPTGLEFQLCDYKRLDYILTRINVLISSSLMKRSDLNTRLCPFLPINTPDEAMDLPFADSTIMKPLNTETTFTCSYTEINGEAVEGSEYEDDEDGNHCSSSGLTLKPSRKPSCLFIGPTQIEVLGMEYAIAHPSSRPLHDNSVVADGCVRPSHNPSCLPLNEIAAAAMMSRPLHHHLSTDRPIQAV